jgi:hypothetical protein
MRRASIAILASLTALLLGAPVAAHAAFGDDFGFAEINTGQPDVAVAPAFSGTNPATGQLEPFTKAIWAGTCDLTSAETEGGGVGPHNGGIEPPALRPHCMDMGTSSLALHPQHPNFLTTSRPWPEGGEPRWRLAPVTQAGAHPDVTGAFYFNRQGPYPDGTVKNIVVKLPPGVVGNPEAVAKCPAVAAQATPSACPASSQAGMVTLAFGLGAGVSEAHNFQTRPVYAIEARDTVTAEFVIASIGGYFNVPVTARGRTNGDYGIDTLAALVPDFVSLAGQSFTFWGTPWAEEHEKWRVNGEDIAHALEPGGQGHGNLTTGVEPESRVPYDPAWGPIKPFFTTPTECSGEQLPLTVDMDSWQDQVVRGGDWVTTTVLTETLTGCEKLEFDPTIQLRPTVDVADSPAGLDVTLEVPQNNDPPTEALGNPNLAFDPSDDAGAPAYWKTDAGLATAHLKDTTVKLPAGTSFNPAAANGLRGCTTSQIGLTSTSPRITFNNDLVQCPESSKIGTLEIVSPLLPDPLEGAVYAAPQHDNPFPGSLTAIYMVAQDYERGLSVKLPGKVDLDPATGQIATTFLDNPQLPFETFELHFKQGPRAPLNTPPVCGQFRNAIDLTPWSFPHSGPIVGIQDPFDIRATPHGQPCATEPEDRIFAPGFEAGSTSTQAGAHTTFNLNVTRRDGDQELSGLSLQMPDGLTAKLAGTPACPDAALAAIEGRTGLEESTSPACPAASQLGTVDTLAGAGPLPLPTAGKLYLGGPFDPDGAGSKPRAPLSVAAVVPAIAGGTPGAPAFDLGNVVVRSAAYLDPKTAQVQIASTPLPYIVGGVPLRVRRVSVQISKPGFMLNPTDCSAMSIGATLGGAADPFDPADDISASLSSSFQVGGCEALGFKPKLSLRLKGGTKRGQNPALTATLRARAGDANIAKAAVTLPRSAFLDQEHLDTICTRVQFAADACPKGSVVGNATAITPLLDGPLAGPVYLRSSDNKLPDMVAVLTGPDSVPIEVELAGRIDSHRRGIRSTFDVVPDAPVSRFVLRMKGGKEGLIENSKNICASPSRATARFTAQNGRVRNMRPKVAVRCKGMGRGVKGKGRKGSRAKGKGR